MGLGGWCLRVGGVGRGLLAFLLTSPKLAEILSMSPKLAGILLTSEITRVNTGNFEFHEDRGDGPELEELRIMNA
jgi:hypothetical protein